MRYTAAHWGVHEVDGPPDAPTLRSMDADPDPSPIGLFALHDDVAAMRVRRPAVRKSWLSGGPGTATALRGKEPFVEVEWETALDLAARDIARVRARHGNSAIFAGSYGWSSAGRFHHAQGQVHRFFNALGGYVRHMDSYSLGAGRVILPHIIGTLDDILSNATSWDVLSAHTELFVSFGGVPLKNAQVTAGGPFRHRVRGALREMAARGTRFVNISPVRDNFDTGGDVEWVPIRPNTDTALMLALAFELRATGQVDHEFLARCTVGYDRFVPYLTGALDGEPKDARWAANITGVPAERIVALAAEMPRRRTLINVAWSLQRASHGEQPFWMLVTLASMVGQIGLPGGGFGLGYGAMNSIGSAHARFAGPTLPQGENRVDAFIPVARIADMLLNPGTPFTYNGAKHIYPDIRLIHWAGGNPFHHHQDLNRLERAWAVPETIIVNEQFWTPTAKRADIVLPATTALEREDIGYATREGVMVSMDAVTRPLDESRDDFSIFAALAERLGAAATYTEGRDAAAWQRRLYDDCVHRARRVGVELPTYDAFRQVGLVDFGDMDQPVVLLDRFRADPVSNPLTTPSGRIEIFSATIAGFCLSDCPGHPVWREPAEWLGANSAPMAGKKKYPLHMISDQPTRRLHSQLDHSPHSRAGKINGRETIAISPADAATRGIADGDIVEVFNDRGRCLAAAIVTDDVMANVVRLSTGAWFDTAADGLETHGNPNVLTLDRGASGLSQGCSAQTCLVEIARFEGEVPPVRAFVPPAFSTL
jgi:biotin/methionine sulfoxide reductase